MWVGGKTDRLRLKVLYSSYKKDVVIQRDRSYGTSAAAHLDAMIHHVNGLCQI